MRTPKRGPGGLWAIALAGGAVVALAAPAFAQEPEPEASPAAALDELVVSAERVEHNEATHTLHASGGVSLTYGGLAISADELVLDTRDRKGSVRGHVLITGEPFRLSAEAGSFDLLAERAELSAFRGTWFGRAQVAGKQLRLDRRMIEVEEGWITPCLHPEPDLRLGARRIRYYPGSDRLNLAVEGAAVQVWERDLLAFPYYATTVGDDDPLWDGSFLPSFGFDAYHGFLTGTRLDFSLGENSRGAIPVTFSTGRGWSAGVQHVLDGVGPGQISNMVAYETPWAANRGGLRAYNSYRWYMGGSGRFELSADYRADVNGQPVTRLPELSWVPLTQNLGGVLLIHNELRAGYLVEETSGARAPRLRWAAPFSTPIWSVGPLWQTWLSGMPFLHAYGEGLYGGGAIAWNHRQTPLPGLAFTQTAELGRIGGETPFFHDRMYDVERLRLSVDKDWGTQVTTSAMVSYSRLNQQGPFAIEDLALIGAYRWNCFGTTLALRPLILGVDVQFQLFNF